MHASAKAIHANEVRHNVFTCVATEPESFEINIFAAHSGDEIVEVSLYRRRDGGIYGGVENPKQTKNIILMLLNHFAVDLLAASLTLGQVDPRSDLQGDDLQGDELRKISRPFTIRVSPSFLPAKT